MKLFTQCNGGIIMTKIEIKNTFTNELLFVFEKENNSIKDTVIEAVKNSVKLDFADLCDADLSGTILTYSHD